MKGNINEQSEANSFKLDRGSFAQSFNIDQTQIHSKLAAQKMIYSQFAHLKPSTSSSRRNQKMQGDNSYTGHTESANALRGTNSEAQPFATFHQDPTADTLGNILDGGVKSHKSKVLATNQSSEYYANNTVNSSSNLLKQ